MRLGILLMLVLSLTSCTDQVVYKGSEIAPEGGWDRKWKPEFEFEIVDTVKQYNTYLDLRHTGDYPYSNLYLFVTLTVPGGETLVDTVECPLAAPDGNWYGKGLGFIHEDRIDAHVLYKYQDRFPVSGVYKMKVEQAMRRQTLEGVLNVGVSIEIVDS